MENLQALKAQKHPASVVRTAFYMHYGTDVSLNLGVFESNFFDIANAASNTHVIDEALYMMNLPTSAIVEEYLCNNEHSEIRCDAMRETAFGAFYTHYFENVQEGEERYNYNIHSAAQKVVEELDRVSKYFI